MSNKKVDPNLLRYKHQVTPDPADRHPPSCRDRDGPLLDLDDATRATTFSGEASTVVADTVVEPSLFPSNNNNNTNTNILAGDVGIRILPPSNRALVENHNPNSLPSATSATLIPIAFVVPDEDAVDTPTGNINSNEAATPTQTNRDHRQNRFALALVSFTAIAVAGIVVVGVVCGSGDCSGGGTTPTEAQPAPMMASSNGITTPSRAARTTLSPVTTQAPTFSTEGTAPAPAPSPVAYSGTRYYELYQFEELYQNRSFSNRNSARRASNAVANQ